MNHLVHINVIGCGELKGGVAVQVVDFRLLTEVRLLGCISHFQFLEIMNRSKVLLHTSSYEGQGLVIQEALAHGMRIVSISAGAMDSKY